LTILSENPEEIKKVEIIRALGSMGSRESLQPLLNILKDEEISEMTLKAVLESLGKIASQGTKDRRISAALAEYLNSADPSLRITAVKGLSAFNDQATVASLLGLFKKERSENVLLSLVERAKYINNPSIIPSIIGLLQNPQTSIELQINCLDTIGAHPEGIKGINGVLTALASSETEIRNAAYTAAVQLYKTNSTALIGGLSRTSAVNKEPLFQQQTAKLYAELPDEASINSLFTMLNTPDPEVKRYATLALYRIRPAGNVRIATALNKMVSNETEPLDVRINAVRALGASGFDNRTIKVEQTLITAATMRDQKYAQLRFYAIRALGQMPSLSSENVDKIIGIASRERDPAIKEEAVQTLSRIGISDPEKMVQIVSALENMDLRDNAPLALMLCEILGEAGVTEFIPAGQKLAAFLTDFSSRRRLAYAFYLTGTEEGYDSMIRLATEESLFNFITSLAESSDRQLLSRVVERMKRSETDSDILELVAIIEAEVLFNS